MSDLDEVIRSVVADIVDGAPEPVRRSAAAQTASPQRRRSRGLVLVAGAAVVAATAGALVVVGVNTGGMLTSSSETSSSSSSSSDSPGTPGSSAAQIEPADGVMNGYPSLHAVASLNPDGVYELDHGAADGVQVGMMVANSEGVVGKVVQVDDSTSVLLLVDDPTYVVGCAVTAAAADVGRACTGVADGTMIARPPVQTGDRVETAGGPDSLAPPGFLIGVASSSTGLFDVAANLAELHDVHIVKYVPTSAESVDTNDTDGTDASTQATPQPGWDCTRTDPAMRPISVARALLCADGTSVWITGVIRTTTDGTNHLCDADHSSDPEECAAAGILVHTSVSPDGTLSGIIVNGELQSG